MSQSTPLITQSRRRPRRRKALGMGGRASAFATAPTGGQAGVLLPDLPAGSLFLVDDTGNYLLDVNNNFLITGP